MKALSRIVVAGLTAGLLAGLMSQPVSAQKDKGKKEDKFEKTGTSADGFLKSAFEMGMDFKKFNTSYDEVKLYVYSLLTQPANVIGKDVASVVVAAQTAGTVPASIEVTQLTTLVGDKAADLKAIKDAAVKNSIAQFITDLNTMVTALGKMPEDAGKLIADATALPDKLKAEMTGLKKAKLPKVLDKVSDGKSNLANIQSEAPVFATNVTAMVTLLTNLAAALGS